MTSNTTMNENIRHEGAVAILREIAEPARAGPVRTFADSAVVHVARIGSCIRHDPQTADLAIKACGVSGGNLWMSRVGASSAIAWMQERGPPVLSAVS